MLKIYIKIIDHIDKLRYQILFQIRIVLHQNKIIYHISQSLKY